MTQSVDQSGTVENSWSLSEVADRLEDIVRAAEAGQAQTIIVDGREAVVVISLEKLQLLREGRTGQALIEAMQACPYPDFELAPSVYSPVRDVEL